MQLHEAIADIGKFPKVFQITASLGLHAKLQQEKAHELISDGPQGPLGASGDLTYHGGPVIGSSAKVFNVHLGVPAYDVGDFDAFTKAIVENGYYLSPDGKDASNGAFIGSMPVAWPFVSMTVDDSAIEAWLDGFVASVPGHDANTMVSLIMPPGSTVTMQGSASCSSFCGYHSMTQRGNYYQVINDTSCAGCSPGVANDGRMMVQSHEYAEWRSDPQGNAWFNDSSRMENADECAWQRIPWGPAGKNWVVQPMWVNGRNCTTPPYVASGPPPPPPPPVATSMKILVQPVDSVIATPMSTVSVQLLDSTGAPVDDNSTVVSVILRDSNTTYNGPSAVTAVAGIASFHGVTPQHLHTGLYYIFSAPGIPGVTSASFNIVAAPSPPPTSKRSLVLTDLDGSTHTFLEQ